jgi:hypothetical protein
MLKSSSEAGSIVCTITVGNVRPKLRPRRRLDSYNFGATDFDYTTGSKHQKRTIVATIAARKVATKVSRSSCFPKASYCSIVSTKDFCLETTNLRRSSCLFMTKCKEAIFAQSTIVQQNFGKQTILSNTG